CRTADRVADGAGASLSDAAGANYRRVSRGRGDRHPGTPHGTMAVGPALPAHHPRETWPRRAANLHRRRRARPPPPRSTLLQIATPNGLNAALYPNLSFNFVHDIAPIIGIMRTSYAIVVHPSVPATTVPEFIAYAKANPGKINMASAGNGTPQHIFGEIF